MALAELAALDHHRAGGFPPDWPADRRLFFSPVDDVHGALLDLIGSATASLEIALYGYDDQALADTIKAKLTDPAVRVTLTLDSSQAGGTHEKTLLAGEAYPNSSVAIGRSEKGAIMHLKVAVVDGLDVVHGSTNWSGGGEDLQDNELLVIRNRTEAFVVSQRIQAIHTHMLAAAPAPTS